MVRTPDLYTEKKLSGKPLDKEGGDPRGRWGRTPISESSPMLTSMFVRAQVKVDVDELKVVRGKALKVVSDGDREMLIGRHWILVGGVREFEDRYYEELKFDELERIEPGAIRFESKTCDDVDLRYGYSESGRAIELVWVCKRMVFDGLIAAVIDTKHVDEMDDEVLRIVIDPVCTASQRIVLRPM